MKVQVSCLVLTTVCLPELKDTDDVVFISLVLLSRLPMKEVQVVGTRAVHAMARDSSMPDEGGKLVLSLSNWQLTM